MPIDERMHPEGDDIVEGDLLVLVEDLKRLRHGGLAIDDVRVKQIVTECRRERSGRPRRAAAHGAAASNQNLDL